MISGGVPDAVALTTRIVPEGKFCACIGCGQTNAPQASKVIAIGR